MTDQFRPALRPALLLGVITLLAVMLASGVFALTRERIARQENQLQRAAIAAVLSATGHDNDPLADSVSVLAPAWLGSGQAAPIRRARKNGRHSALVLEIIANDRIDGPNHLLVGVDNDGRISGVRLMARRDSLGVGDAASSADRAWINGLRGRTLANLPRAEGEKGLAGHLGMRRALLDAVRQALTFVATHGEEIRLAKAGTTLVFNAANDPTTIE